MEVLTLTLAFVLTVCLMLYGLVSNVRQKEIKTARRVLLVTSHPDDECMFFGPTVLSLTANPIVTVFLLTLSTGNFGNDGSTRKRELYSAARVLGIPEENITILNYTKLQDNPAERWREEIVSNVILHVVVSQDIDTVVTFDRHGVSGHKNRCAIFTALAQLVMDKRLPGCCRVFALKTVSLARKYACITDVPLSFLLATWAYVAGPKRWLQLRAAMAAHESQYVRFRKLYIVISRYAFINTFDEMTSYSMPSTSQKRD